MNNSTPRDVQDLIAEFVSSKDQLLHEEIISSIKRESFANLQEEESSQVDIPSQIINTAMQKPAESIEALEKKIELLMERNLELQQELTMAQMQESQIIASAKPIGADELRMEFLNFTSAHIQQFNTRIKKTEELIESQIQKNQNPAERTSKGDYPVWLFWTNIAALGLIAVYFLFQIFADNNNEAAGNNKEAVKKAIATEASDNKTNVKAQQPQSAVIAEKTVSEEPMAQEPVSTPFHNTATTALTANSLEDKNQTATPASTEAANKQTLNRSATRTNTVAKQTVKPVAKIAEKPSPGQTVTASAAKPVSQPKVVSPVNPKPQTEKKSANKEKVYFGED